MKITSRLPVLFLVAIILFPTITIAQTFQLSHYKVFGKVESDSVEYLFGGPKAIVTDSKLRVYISDGSQNSVKLFSQDGNYITPIGRRGRGPGEFLDVTDMTIDQHDNLYILDRLSYRVTRFNNLNWEENGTYNLPAKSNYSAGASTFPIAIHYLNDNKFAIAVTGVQRSADFKLISLVDTTFNESIGSFISPMKTIMHPDIPSSANLTLASSPSYWSTTYGRHKIAVVHRNFTGKIASVIPSSENGHTSTLGSWIEEPYRFMNPNQSLSSIKNPAPGMVAINGSQGRVVFQSLYGSVGLVGNSSYLLHFYRVVSNNTFESFLDVYSATGNLLSTLSLDEIGIRIYNEDNRIRLIPLHFDNENKIYFADYSNGLRAPVVRILKLTSDG